MEIGVYTFAEVAGPVSAQQRMRDLLEEAELADRVGLDVFGVGEHHRPDFAVSAPGVALAAILNWAITPLGNRWTRSARRSRMRV